MTVELITITLLALTASPAGISERAPARARSNAVATAEWNAEGVYEWLIPELSTGGTLTVFKRSDGSWGSHGNIGGPEGAVLLCRETTVSRTALVAHADGSMGKMVITIKHADGAYTGMIDLDEIGIAIGASIKKVSE